MVCFVRVGPLYQRFIWWIAAFQQPRPAQLFMDQSEASMYIAWEDWPRKFDGEVFASAGGGTFSYALYAF